MLGGVHGDSPASETMSDGTLERNRAEKALITKTPSQSQTFLNKTGLKNYSDKNGNDVTKIVHGGRKTFAFWTLACLLFILAIGNLMLSVTILVVLRLGSGMESMEFLPEQHAIKLFGAATLEHVYKRDGLLESFLDEPLSISSEGGAVVFGLQTRLSRSETRVTVNTSGVFIRGVSSLGLVSRGVPHVTLGAGGAGPRAQRCTLPEAVANLQARQISTKRISAPVDEDLVLHSDSATYLRGAEGTHMESKELLWTADQDIFLKSINGSVVLSGKEGVYIDVRYLPIAIPSNKTGQNTQHNGQFGPNTQHNGQFGPNTQQNGQFGQNTQFNGQFSNNDYNNGVGQFKVCVCMPQGKLFRVAVTNGRKAACSHVNMTGENNPCA